MQALNGYTYFSEFPAFSKVFCLLQGPWHCVFCLYHPTFWYHIILKKKTACQLYGIIRSFWICSTFLHKYHRGYIAIFLLRRSIMLPFSLTKHNGEFSLVYHCDILSLVVLYVYSYMDTYVSRVMISMIFEDTQKATLALCKMRAIYYRILIYGQFLSEAFNLLPRYFLTIINI